MDTPLAAGSSIAPATCWRLLASVGHVRVAYTAGALPALAVAPVLVERSALVVVAAAGSPLARAAGSVLALQADGTGSTREAPGGPATGPQWSVTVVGPADEVDVDRGDIAAALAGRGHLVRAHDRLLRVHAGMVSGQRL